MQMLILLKEALNCQVPWIITSELCHIFTGLSTQNLKELAQTNEK